jgi:hypothetical protein
MPSAEFTQALLEVLENQLRAGDPPETRQTLERLLAAGYAREVAMAKLCGVLREEIDDMMARRVPFHRGRFKQRLDQLR